MKKIALLGDSLSTGFFVSSTLPTLYRSWTLPSPNWFDSPHFSLKTELFKGEEVVTKNFSRVCSAILSPRSTHSLYRFALRANCLKDQVNHLLQSQSWPDLILIWIGHNNMDWKADSKGLCEKTYLSELPHILINEYRNQTLRILRDPRFREKKTQLALMGLVDFKRFFQAREHHLNLNESFQSMNSLKRPESIFLSFDQRYQGEMAALSRRFNSELNSLTHQLRRLDLNPQSVIYLPTVSHFDIQKNDLHPSDAWHLSPQGHRRLATSISKDLRPFIFPMNSVPTPKRNSPALNL